MFALQVLHLNPMEQNDNTFLKIEDKRVFTHVSKGHDLGF